jgi:putative iron-dependent peroxidase
MPNTPQAGIFADDRRYHYYLEYRLAGGAARGAIVGALNQALDAFPTEQATRPEVVVAFGNLLWSSLAPGEDSPGLRDFETIRGVHGYEAPSTQADLWCWLNGPGLDTNFASAMAFHAALGPVLELTLDLPAFTYFASRDLIDFEDGTANPKGDDRHAVALVPDGLPGAGGSFVLTQRWATDLDAFNALPVAEQEAIIGRTKADSIELEGDAMPDDSHVSRTDVSVDGVALKIFRRSAPYGDLEEHGLYFVAFACEQRRHQIQLERMFGASGDGFHDRLIEFSAPKTGSYFFAPGVEALNRALGRS